MTEHEQKRICTCSDLCSQTTCTTFALTTSEPEPRWFQRPGERLRSGTTNAFLKGVFTLYFVFLPLGLGHLIYLFITFLHSQKIKID